MAEYQLEYCCSFVVILFFGCIVILILAQNLNKIKTIILMKTSTVVLSLQNNYSAEMGDLRQFCYPDDYIGTDCKDEFDDKSYHIVLKNESQLIAYGRLTAGPNSVFYTWTKGKAELPYAQDSIDLGRCMVHPDYRRKNLFQLICITGLLVSKNKGFTYTNGAVVAGSAWLNTLETIGLQKSGKIVPAKNDVLIQPLSCYLRSSTIDFDNLLKIACDNMLLNDMRIGISL